MSRNFIKFFSVLTISSHDTLDHEELIPLPCTRVGQVSFQVSVIIGTITNHSVICSINFFYITFFTLLIVAELSSPPPLRLKSKILFSAVVEKINHNIDDMFHV